MAIYRLSRKYYSEDSESDSSYKIKQGLHHAWDTIKGAAGGAAIGTGISLVSTGIKASKAKRGYGPATLAKNLMKGAAIGGGIGGVFGYLTSDKLVSEKEKKLIEEVTNIIPKGVNEFIAKLKEVCELSSKELKINLDNRLGSDASDSLVQSELDSLLEFVNLPNCLEIGRFDTLGLNLPENSLFDIASISVGDDSIWYNKGGYFATDIVYNVRTNRLGLVFIGNKNKLIEVNNTKDLIRLFTSEALNKWSFDLVNDPTEVINYVFGGVGECDIPVEYVKVYMEEFNKVVKNIIKMLNK